jgi:hypothetical protein
MLARKDTVKIKMLREFLDDIIDFFVDDCIFDRPHGTEPWGTRVIGKAEVRKGLGTRFEGIPNVHYGEDRHWVPGTAVPQNGC